MITKKLKKVASIILFIVAIYFCIFLLQNYMLKKSYLIYNEGRGGDSFIRCNFNILKPEFATVFFAIGDGHIGFRKTNILFQSFDEWLNNRSGGTTVKNTTLSELIEMVKDDCYQFQQHNGEPTDETINWSYSEYIQRKPVTNEVDDLEASFKEIEAQFTPEEIEKDREFFRQLRLEERQKIPRVEDLEYPEDL